LQHQNLQMRGFKCVAAFDNDPDKIGTLTRSGLRIRDIEEVEEAVKELDIRIGVITTPAAAAQAVADRFLRAEINAILNFSPTKIWVPECCLVENIDFTVTLDVLAFELNRERAAAAVRRA